MISIFGMAAMPFLFRGVWFSPKQSYHSNISLVVYLPILNFSFCQKTFIPMFGIDIFMVLGMVKPKAVNTKTFQLKTGKDLF